MKQQVMIVDDDAHVCIAVSTILEDAGYEVVIAESGDACLSYLKAGFTGLILLDIMMPDLDGWDTIRKILDEDLYHHIVIVMLTAKSVPDTKMIGLQEYIFDYLTKPFESEDLVTKTHYYLQFV